MRTRCFACAMNIPRTLSFFHLVDFEKQSSVLEIFCNIPLKNSHPVIYCPQLIEKQYIPQ
eukprot:4292811-Pleurochrysis_carterae.AAC.1